MSPAYAYAESDYTTETTSVTTTPAITRVMELKKNSDRKDLKAEYLAKTKALRDEYKAKLATIKDERKKTIVEKIDGSLANVNKRRTDEMSENLTKMSSILERISSKAATLKGQGKDTANLDTSITNAKTAITSAQDAVTAQAAKEYVITITSESTLKTDVSPVVLQFKTDIKSVHDKVVEARKAVVDAAKQLGLLIKPSTAPTSTSTQ